MFFPESYCQNNIDGFGGGRFGTGLTLRFLKVLPDLLSDEGEAWILTAAPILAGGRDFLAEQLVGVAGAAGVDVDRYSSALARNEPPLLAKNEPPLGDEIGLGARQITEC